MNFILNFLTKIIAMFHKPKVEAAFNTVAQLLSVAEPIVEQLAALVPNQTVQEILAAYEHYGIPVVGTVLQDPTSTGSALLNLATQLVQKTTNNTMATNIVQTAVQIAVTAMKAQ